MKKKRELTPEQKQALVERLQKARQSKNPPQYKSIHPTVLAKPASDILSFDSVKRYLKTQKELLVVTRQEARKDVKGALAKVCSMEGYIRVLENYLRTGDYGGMFYGEYEEHAINNICIRVAYDQKTGLVKRNVGTYYPDMGMVYTKEMWLNDNT